MSWLCCKKNDPSPVVLPREGNRILLVGINTYRDAPLKGCVNDVTDMANYLTDTRGIDPRDICLITDARATTTAIMDKLVWLSETSPGNLAYFHYSGHGTQVPSYDEEDGMNEAICPVDFDWSPSRMITDKDFVEIFRTMSSGVIFNWASDSCHSGDLSREIEKEGQKSTPRRMPLPADIAWRIDKTRSRGRTFVRSIRQSELNVGYISGCGPDQTSADAYIGGRYCGAFTYFYLKNLKSEPLTTPLDKLAEVISSGLASSYYEQRPQAEGLRAKKPFLG